MINQGGVRGYPLTVSPVVFLAGNPEEADLPGQTQPGTEQGRESNLVSSSGSREIGESVQSSLP